MKPTRLLIAFGLFLFVLPVFAADVPSRLPDPDGKPGNTTKPVRVYILAGQSNMVGSDSKVKDIQRFPPFAGLESPQKNYPTSNT